MEHAVYDLSQLELVRSDQGDGGWSIHVRRTDIDDTIDPARAWPIVLCGEGGAWDEDAREWERPTDAEWDQARARARELAEEAADDEAWEVSS